MPQEKNAVGRVFTPRLSQGVSGLTIFSLGSGVLKFVLDASGWDPDADVDLHVLMASIPPAICTGLIAGWDDTYCITLVFLPLSYKPFCGVVC